MNIYEKFSDLKEYAEKQRTHYIICFGNAVDGNFDKLHFIFDERYFNYKFAPYDFICIAYRKSGNVLYLRTKDNILKFDN